MAGVAEPEPPPEERAEEPPRREFRGLALKLAVGVVVVALLGYGAFRVASQERSPSGAREAAPLGPPAVPGLGEITATCSPTLQRARGNVFSTALDIRAAGEAWSSGALERVGGELASLASAANPGFYVRVGAPVGPGPQGSSDLDWKRGLEPGSKIPRVDDLVASIRDAGAEPQLDVEYFSSGATGAGDLVAFLNGTDGSDPDVALRKAAGRPDPPRVELFELGSHPPVAKGASSQAARSYGRDVAELSQAMRRRSPTPIKLLAPLTDWRLSGGVVAAAEIVAETSANVDGYTISFSPPADVPLYESAGQLEATVAEVRRLIEAKAAGKPMMVVVVPWDMSAFARPGGPTWKAALAAAAGSVTAAGAGVSIMNYPGIPPSYGETAGYTYWPGADPERPSPTYVLTRVLVDRLPREFLNTEITLAAAPDTDPGPTPRPARRPLTAEGLLAQCAREEGERYLAILNLSGDPTVVNVRVEFQVGDRMTKTVLVAPVESPTVEQSTTEFVSRTWYSDSIPPYSVTIWTFPRGAG